MVEGGFTLERVTACDSCHTALKASHSPPRIRSPKGGIALVLWAYEQATAISKPDTV